MPGWYLLTMSATSLGMPYAFMGQGDFGVRAIPSAVLYDLGGNTWLCQVGFAFLGRIGAPEVAPRRPSSATDAELSVATELSRVSVATEAPLKSALRRSSKADPTSVSDEPLRPETATRPKSARFQAPEDVESSGETATRPKSARFQAPEDVESTDVPYSPAAGDADRARTPERLGPMSAGASMLSDAPRGTRMTRVRRTLANVNEAVIQAHGISTKQILRDNILLNPVIAAFVFGCSMNVSGVPMPVILEDCCAKLSTSFSCMMYFMIGSCIELRRPSWSEVSPAFVALALRTCLQVVLAVMFPYVVMLYGRRLLFQDEIDYDLRRAFLMCMLSPCTNMIMFWSGQYDHSADLSAFYITLSNLFSIFSLGGLSAVLLESEFGTEQRTMIPASTNSTAY
jgi:predicted permease